MKIIATGNPQWGLAKSIAKYIDAEWHGRSTGWDLMDLKQISKFAEFTLDFDVFVNNSKLNNFHQVILLKEVAVKWRNANKTGQIINIGSTADVAKLHTGFYPAEKMALTKYNNQIHYYYSCRKSGIRSTIICPGVIDIESSTNNSLGKLDPDIIGQAVKWVIDMPANMNIEMIRMDPQE